MNLFHVLCTKLIIIVAQLFILVYSLVSARMNKNINFKLNTYR